MSFNRENVIWQSKDGTWSRGFYEVVWTDPDGDPEWDVEYGSGLEWVSTGHPTREAAHRSWDGANPGSCWVIEYADSSDTCDDLDEKAKRCKAAAREAERRMREAGIRIYRF